LRKQSSSKEAGMLHDPDIRRALAAQRAETLRRSMAAATEPRLRRRPLRWQLGRVLVTAGLRLTRDAPVTGKVGWL
jgi:hypothetical protein